MSARRRHRRGRHVLPLLGLMLLTSAGLRLAEGERPAADEAARLAHGLVLSLVSAATAQEGESAGETPPELEKVMSALSDRERRLDEREARLEERAQTLNAAEARIRQQLEDLAAAQQELARTIDLADDAAENDLAQLTAVYEAMTPADAAALFETMTPTFAAGFLGRMRPELSAGILAALPTDVAHAISVVLAGRHADVPTE